jgi:hypothetical protein
MKKSSLFFLSLVVAVIIAYNKRPAAPQVMTVSEGKWKTFEKKSSEKIVAHPSTDEELAKGNITRKIASVNPVNPQQLLNLREDRILTGDDIDRFKDENIDLPMMNKINPDWKELLGNELLRFQKEDTKIIIKDELKLIKITNGQGQYFEQVVITYFLKNGDQNSFHALVNSENGAVTDTWDRTIHERFRRKPVVLTPTGPSNIIGR